MWIIYFKGAMGYEIEFGDESRIVTVKYAGAVSLTERLNAVKDVCISYSHLNPLRILINVTGLNMQLSYEKQKYFSAYLAANKYLENAKVAVLHNKNNNPNIVVDTTAFVTGYKLAQFDVEKEALSWLRDA